MVQTQDIHTVAKVRNMKHWNTGDVIGKKITASCGEKYTEGFWFAVALGDEANCSHNKAKRPDSE